MSTTSNDHTWTNYSLRCWGMFRARFDPITFERKRPVPAAKARIDPARVTELSAGLASPPDRCAVRTAMAALWPGPVAFRVL